MDKTKLLELLANDPFDTERRFELACVYAQEGDWKRVHGQLKLIKRERELTSQEHRLRIDALRELGFDEEADALDSVRGPELQNQPPEASPKPTPVLPDETDDAAADDPSDVTQEPKRVPLSVVPTASNVVDFSNPGPQTQHVAFSDIGGLAQVKRQLQIQIIEPFKHPERFAKYGKSAGGGVLMYGPPGCGKTMLAKAVASECNATFIEVAISEILSPYQGQSEINLADVFLKARELRPSVLFFDEVDSLAISRGRLVNDTTRNIVNEFLRQLDGVGVDNENVLVLAATNMPWEVDAAMKRPGRFSRTFFVPPPDHPARVAILQQCLDGLPQKKIDFDKACKDMRLFSGADIVGLVDMIKDDVLADVIESGKDRDITMKDLSRALSGKQATTREWFNSAVNLVRFSGLETAYRDLEQYMKVNRLI